MDKPTQPAATPLSSKPRRWVIAGLATAAVAAVGAATLTYHENAQAQMEHAFGFGAAKDPAVTAKRIDAMVQWMLADINGVTDDQRTKIATILKAAANDLAPLRTQHMQARKTAMQLLAAPTIDRAQLESIRVQQMQLADTATRRMTQALADAAEVLNPDQRTQLVAKWQRHRGHRHGGVGS